LNRMVSRALEGVAEAVPQALFGGHR
jgi:hypothetical protein